MDGPDVTADEPVQWPALLAPLPDAGVGVSVVVPARDSAATLAAAVRSALGQELPDAVSPFEVVVAVGPSSDDTARVAADLASDPRVRVVDNPVGVTPAALNAAIAASAGEVVVRLDAHALLPPGYVATAVDVLRETGAANVGGMQVPTADRGFRQAVATAMRSPLGAGGATYRVGGEPGPVETVYLGVFRRAALELVGGFDESLVRNQDFELNHRLRRAGLTVWFDPRLQVAYTPRGTVGALWRQYHDYGRWKRVVLRRHPGSLKLRQLAPPLLVVGLCVGLAVWPFTSPATFVILLSLWLIACMVEGMRTSEIGSALPVAIALATMHLAWGTGFLRGGIRVEGGR